MPILEAINRMCSSSFWKSISGGEHFQNIPCSNEDFQKIAAYLQKKNISDDCLRYLKEHIWLG